MGKWPKCKLAVQLILGFLAFWLLFAVVIWSAGTTGSIYEGDDTKDAAIALTSVAAVALAVPVGFTSFYRCWHKRKNGAFGTILLIGCVIMLMCGIVGASYNTDNAYFVIGLVLTLCVFAPFGIEIYTIRKAEKIEQAGEYLIEAGLLLCDAEKGTRESETTKQWRLTKGQPITREQQIILAKKALALLKKSEKYICESSRSDYYDIQQRKKIAENILKDGSERRRRLVDASSVLSRAGAHRELPVLTTMRNLPQAPI